MNLLSAKIFSVDPNIGGLVSVPPRLSCLNWWCDFFLNTLTASLNKVGIRLESILLISIWWSVIGNLGWFSQTKFAPKWLADWIISVASNLHGHVKMLFRPSLVYVTVWAKTRHVRTQLELKFILLPQLIATLNKYACSLPPLANVDWSAFSECFLPTM